MAAARVVFHPGASEDYAVAFSWYYTRGTALASDFESEIDRGIRLISRYPLRWPKFDDQRRRLIVRKFPYSIIYELHGNNIVVLAVAHGKRRPNYWRERTVGKSTRRLSRDSSQLSTKRMKNHPTLAASSVREPLGSTVTATAKRLGVKGEALHRALAEAGKFIDWQKYRLG